jgi:uroporphyrinogen decarboxylase
MSVGIQPHHVKLAEDLVARTKAAGGMAPVDVERFWADQDKAKEDVWSPDCPQMPLGMTMSQECLFAELGIEEDWRRFWSDRAWRAELSKPYNDKAERIVGRRILNETPPEPGSSYTGIKGLHDLFEARNEFHAGSWWLMESAHGPDELRALLDRVDERLENLREFLLPDDWDAQKDRLMPRGIKPPLYRSQRGPVTFATSIYGGEDLIFLLVDEPDLARRFSETILRAMLERARILDEEAGYTPQTAPRGFSWADDNCCLLNPEMYELFGWPILKGMFDRYAPDPDDWRFQHSDSDMGHLLPLLGKLDLRGTNFGPTVMIDEIRAHLPNAVIKGELAPFTLSRNEEVNILAELARDIEMGRQKKGILWTTAGSINNGSLLTSMRLIMAGIQEFGWLE